MSVITLDEFILPIHRGTTGEQAEASPTPGHIRLITTVLQYASPVLLCVCTVGNLLSALTLRRLYPGVLSTTLYVFVLLLADPLILWTRDGLEWIHVTLHADVRRAVTSSSAAMCKIYPWLVGFLYNLSVWLLVLMASETAYVYQRPLRLMRVCRAPRARLTLATLATLLCLSHIHSFWTHQLAPVAPGGSAPDGEAGLGQAECSSSQGDDLRRIIVVGVELILSEVIPYFVVFSCAVMLVTKRVRRRDQVRQIDNTWKACNIDSSTAHQLHTSFIALSVLHTVLLFPRLSFKSFLFVTDPLVAGRHATGAGDMAPNPGALPGGSSIALHPSTIIAKAVCYLLQYLFMSVKIFVFAGCSSSFRFELRSLLTCFRSSHQHLNSSHHTNCPIITHDGNHVGVATSGAINEHTILTNHEQSLLMHNQSETSNLMNDIKPDGLTSATILENGTPCIKIFSMTSV